MAIGRFGLIARHTLPAAVEALESAARWIADRGGTPVIETRSAEAAGLHDWPIVEREALPGASDVIIAFGGDGTLLDAAGIVAHAATDVPLLGVNLGRLGFLTEVGRHDMVETLAALVEGRTRIDARLMLAGRVERDGRTLAERFVLNDVIINRGAPSRMIEIDVSVDDRRVCRLKADGVLISSATGSTAYNLSAGGPIVHPEVDAVVFTPIAPHALTQRPIVLPASAAIALRPLPEDPPAEVVVTFDGQHSVTLAPDDLVTVTRAPRVLRLLRTSSRTHFDMLREKLKWGH